MQDRPSISQGSGFADSEEAASGRIATDGNRAIFVYSGFRASSTWLWSRFRMHEKLLCYYEPFNEQLNSLTLQNIGEARFDGWRSRHPRSAPYVLEYAGMLGKDAGIPGFPAATSLGDRYISAAGVAGPLDDDVAAYTRDLIDHAQQQGRVPLLSCTRMLGRAAGLKAAFGGYHVLLIRNLFHQWNSYAGQARFGNWYFLQTLYETLDIAALDPVIARLANMFPESTRVSLETWVTAENFDRVFCYFAAFHLYFLTMARRSCDLVVDANLVARDNHYRRNIVDTIEAAIGIRLDLNDASERVDFPLRPIADRQTCKILVNELAAMIKTACHADQGEQSFIDALVGDLWSEQATFQRQTSGAFEYLAEMTETGDARLADAQQHGARQMQEADARYEAVLLERDEAHSHLARQESESGATIADLQGRLAEQEAALSAMRAHLAQAQDQAAEQEELAVTRDALSETREALLSAREDAEAKRVCNTQREAELTAALAQNEMLQDLLASAEETAAQLHTRIEQLEGHIASVDAANVDLAGRLRTAERESGDLGRLLAAERNIDRQPPEQIARTAEVPDARDRLQVVLDQLSAHRLQWAILPQPLWRRRLASSLAALPDFAAAADELQDGAASDRLADAIWTALLRRG